jgi:hypothetical protein
MIILTEGIDACIFEILRSTAKNGLPRHGTSASLYYMSLA